MLLRGPGAGLAQNFWQAAAHTDAELMAWADQDDVWTADKLARCEALAGDVIVSAAGNASQKLIRAR